MFNVFKETIEIAKVEYKHEPTVFGSNIAFEFIGKMVGLCIFSKFGSFNTE